MPEQNVVRVAVSQIVFAIDKAYNYRIPEQFYGKISPGMRLMVPFGRANRRCEAMALSLEHQEDAEELKEVIDVLDAEPILDEDGLRLAVWVRDQCFCTLYDVFRAMLPSGLWYRFGQVYIPREGATEEEFIAALPGNSNAAELAEYFLLRKSGVEENALCMAFGLSDAKPLLKQLQDAGLVSVKDKATRKVADKRVRMASLAVDPEEAEKYIASNKKRAPVQCDVLRMLCDIGRATTAEIGYFTGATGAAINTLEKRGMLQLDEIESFRRPQLPEVSEPQQIHLNYDQERVYRSISKMIWMQKSGVAMLYGVTGSGKTMVYLKLIEAALEIDRTAMLLVPEIALTPQMLAHVYQQFGDRVAVMHSALSVGEQLDEWKRIRRGEVSVVVGTRSAVFMPLPNLGLIILDEEHDHSYKSNMAPRYHAREVARFRCVQNHAIMLLGSATPSVESMYSAVIGQYSFFQLPYRYNQLMMPEVVITNMRTELLNGNTGEIGTVLAEELEKNLIAGNQSIIFLNRRGQARYASCVSCGYVPECPNCSAALTYHSANGRFMCHHCGYSQVSAALCPKCSAPLAYIGAGTQKIEEELHEMFPGIPVLRMDRDTATTKTAREQMLRRFQEEKVPILVGTQMVAKGFHFEDVTLVGVLGVDQLLYAPTWRAQENTFDLITQVIGRAGRGDKRGRAVIQTLSKDNETVLQAAVQDYRSFFRSELTMRELRKLPPFRDMISLVVSSTSENQAYQGAVRLAERLRAELCKVYSEMLVSFYGPAPAAVLRVRGKFRYQLTLCGENTRALRTLLSDMICDFQQETKNRRLTILVDVNTYEF